MANILLILEHKDVFVIQEKLNMFFLNVSKEDKKLLNIVLNKIEDYATNGYLIKQCFCRDVMDEEVKQSREETLSLLKKRRNCYNK